MRQAHLLLALSRTDPQLDLAHLEALEAEVDHGYSVLLLSAWPDV